MNFKPDIINKLDRLLQLTKEYTPEVILLFVLVLVFLSWLATAIRRIGNFPRNDIAQRNQSRLVWVFTDIMQKVVDQFRHILATLVVLGIIVVLAILVVSPGDKDHFQVTLSAFTGILGTIMGYYFGERTNDSQGETIENVDENDLEQRAETPEFDQVEPFDHENLNDTNADT